MIDTWTPHFFPRTDMTEREGELGQNGVPNNGLLFMATVCYTEITDLRVQ